MDSRNPRAEAAMHPSACRSVESTETSAKANGGGAYFKRGVMQLCPGEVRVSGGGREGAISAGQLRPHRQCSMAVSGPSDAERETGFKENHVDGNDGRSAVFGRRGCNVRRDMQERRGTGWCRENYMRLPLRRLASLPRPGRTTTATLTEAQAICEL